MLFPLSTATARLYFAVRYVHVCSQLLRYMHWENRAWQERLRRKLEEDLEYTRKLLQTEKAKAADAQKRAGGADKTRRSEQRDQIKLLQELQDFR